MKELVLFVQDNCVPCKQFKPLVESACERLDLSLGYVDVTDNWGLAKQWNIQSTPTLIVIEDVEEVDRISARTMLPLLQELKEKCG